MRNTMHAMELDHRYVQALTAPDTPYVGNGAPLRTRHSLHPQADTPFSHKFTAAFNRRFNRPVHVTEVEDRYHIGWLDGPTSTQVAGLVTQIRRTFQPVVRRTPAPHRMVSLELLVDHTMAELTPATLPHAASYDGTYGSLRGARELSITLSDRRGFTLQHDTDVVKLVASLVRGHEPGLAAAFDYRLRRRGLLAIIEQFALWQQPGRRTYQDVINQLVATTLA